MRSGVRPDRHGDAGTRCGAGELAASWTARKSGYSLEDAAEAIGSSVWKPDPDDPRLYDYLAAELRSGVAFIAYVHAVALGEIRAKRSLAAAGPHGALGPGRHTVILVGSASDGILYLDPFFPADGQPFCAT